MAAADLLVKLMFSWIEQRESCAEQLKKLADELESLREKCNVAECVGNTAAVAGAAGLIGAGVATFLTAGAATPVLVLAGGAYGVGAAVTVATKIIERLSSSDTLKEAQKIEKKSNEIAENIQKQFEQLNVEKVSSLKTGGKQSKDLIVEGIDQLIKQMSLIGLKIAGKGGVMVVGAAVGLGFALHEAIDSWKDLIEKNHETEASRSMRDTADNILERCSTLRGELRNIEKMLDKRQKKRRVCCEIV